MLVYFVLGYICKNIKKKKKKKKKYKIKNNMKFSLQLVISEFLRLRVQVEFV